ncbi:MAG: DUF3419 family protein [Ignavibacteriales bacterium]
MNQMHSEAAEHAKFSMIRYAQCWEDADILLPALNIQKGSKVLSVASAGDNSFAMLTQDPAKVYVIDLSPAQLACVKIRMEMYKTLPHQEFLELMGSIESTKRMDLYKKIRGNLDEETRKFWDALPDQVENGIGGAGKFEKYFRLFGLKILPLVESKKKIDILLQAKPRDEREAFYNKKWNNWRWRLMFEFFFSRTVMGRLGRDPSFFRYVEGSVAKKILERVRYAMVELDPALNPYFYWILRARHDEVLPFALREENFNIIRERIDRIEVRLQSVEDFLIEAGASSINAFNLSDIFEYVSEHETERLLSIIADVGCDKARIAYWNMLALRKRPDLLADKIISLDDIAKELFEQDKAFFYSAFRVEEVVK